MDDLDKYAYWYGRLRALLEVLVDAAATARDFQVAVETLAECRQAFADPTVGGDQRKEDR